MSKVLITIKVTDCRQCPYCQAERTKGAGYAYDYFCRKQWEDPLAVFSTIATYVEYDSEFPKEIPMWCPFRKENMSETVG